jgi:hypothetical protein
METKFIVDNNVGKLARLLRMIGYDTLLFKEKDDGKMIRIALSDHRMILTRDTQIMKRRLVTTGELKAMLITQDEPKLQLQETAKTLNLDYDFRPFSLCLECNQRLIPRSKDEVQNSVPPYVFKTRDEYMECPLCHRIYWQGTHWQAMIEKLRSLAEGPEPQPSNL